MTRSAYTCHTTPEGVRVTFVAHAASEREAAEAMLQTARAQLEALDEEDREEHDTIEAVIRDWEAAGNTASRNPEGRLVYFDAAWLAATWDTQANDGLPLRVADGGWTPGTLNGLRRALGLEVKR